MIVLRNKNFSSIDWFIKFEKPWINLTISSKNDNLKENESKEEIIRLMKWLDDKKLLSVEGKEFINGEKFDYRISPFMVNKKGEKVLDKIFIESDPNRKDWQGKRWYELDWNKL